MTRTAVVRVAALVAAASLSFAACSSDDNSSSSTKAGDSGGGGNSSSSGLDTAKASTEKALKGTSRPVDPTSRPAVKGKHIVVISAGQAASSSQVPSDAAVAAAKAIGWKVDLYDAALNPSKYAPLVRQAIAANADGIVLDAIDCQTVKEPLKEAKAKHIAVVAIYAFDCNDSKGGGEKEGLYSAQINFGPDAKDIDAFTESYGADQANYIIANSDNKAKVIAINDPEFTVLLWTLSGFKKAIEKSGGSEIVDTLDVTTADLTSNKIVPKIQAELLRHPEATWIKSPYTYVTTLGIAPALGANPKHISVMGGEGFAAELDLIRQGKITATNGISSKWTGWASIDTMNSVFADKKPVDSGIGWTMVDKDHNLPASGDYTPPIDYQAAYQKAWGVSG
jgi:ribose transport system substrate-binding protein